MTVVRYHTIELPGGTCDPPHERACVMELAQDRYAGAAKVARAGSPPPPVLHSCAVTHAVRSM